MDKNKTCGVQKSVTHFGIGMSDTIFNKGIILLIVRSPPPLCKHLVVLARGEQKIPVRICTDLY